MNTNKAVSTTTPEANSSFTALKLSSAMQANLVALGYTSMTPIQEASLPITLAGHDLIGQAKTGSGKTASFALPMLAKLDLSLFEIQGLVMCPTRELADQVTQEIRRLARAADNIKVVTLTGGVLMRGQRTSLEHGAHIAVGTPGRLLDLLEKGNLSLHRVNTLVLDEADLMLDMGFYDSIQAVIKQVPQQRQTLLFSATYPEAIQKLGASLTRNAQRITVQTQHSDAKIHQLFFEIQEEDRLPAVLRLLQSFAPVRTLAFCNTKQQCKDLLALLDASGFSALALHGELEQRDRDQVLVQFANRSCSVLVATDVAARGLDITDLEAVLNVDVTFEPEQHIHRVGRTGRVDNQGLALNLVSVEEMGRIARIEDIQQRPVQWQEWSTVKPNENAKPAQPPMATLQLQIERKEKIRAGDVLGALTGEGGINGKQVGKITVAEFSTYVAVERAVAKQAQAHLIAAKVKGKSVRVRLL